jgi:poly(3-hydroxybutyrate) depolymerase
MVAVRARYRRALLATELHSDRAPAVGRARARSVQAMQKEFNIDPDRVFVTGFSNGGFMASILVRRGPSRPAHAAAHAAAASHQGCVAPDIFRATASVSGIVELVPGAPPFAA